MLEEIGSGERTCYGRRGLNMIIFLWTYRDTDTNEYIAKPEGVHVVFRNWTEGIEFLKQVEDFIIANSQISLAELMTMRELDAPESYKHIGWYSTTGIEMIEGYLNPETKSYIIEFGTALELGK